MFTGIIEQTSSVLKIDNSCRLMIKRPREFGDIKLGDSISVDGVCLTIDYLTSEEVGFFVSKVTRDVAKSYKTGDVLNLERAVKYGDRINGHLVTGHVYCTGLVTSVKGHKATLDLEVSLPDEVELNKKSCISINGVSLTINEVDNNKVNLHIIPETLKRTNLRFLKVGSLVNIEPNYSDSTASTSHYSPSLAYNKARKQSSSLKLNTTLELVEDIKQGKMVILVDDEERENEGDLVVASEFITSDKVNFMVKHARGLVCVSITDKQAKRLHLPLMVEEGSNFSHNNTAFTLSVEAGKGVTTGISAADRATTIRALCNPKASPTDIVSPGHIFPIKAIDGGVLKRAGHTEGSVDLVKLAGLTPSATVCEIMKDNGQMARMKDLVEFARVHEIKIGSIADLIRYRIQNESLVYEACSCDLPLEGCGVFQLKVFKTTIDNAEHVVLKKGEIKKDTPVLIRVHSQCMTGDVFSSQRCDCGKQLKHALNKIDQNGSGIVLYLRQEGRGIGLVNKIKSYVLQDSGLDTVEANMHLGFRPDERDYGIGAQILRKLGVRKINLMTNNPSKKVGLDGYGLEISKVIPIEIKVNKHNVKYMGAKKEKMGHILKMLES